MKTRILFLITVLGSALCLSAQTPAPQRLTVQGASAVKVPEDAASLTHFDLDFPGGTPADLVAAIQKAMNRPVNAIIPAEHARIQLPPLKMTNVDVPHLFAALQSASLKTEAYVTSTYYGGGIGGPSQSYQSMVTSYGFKTGGPLTDDSIWYFYAERPSFPPLVQTKACRFYLLTPYLERGFTVDDITTAIRTGWQMIGDEHVPSISFHKETKLLIAVGEPSKLETIDSVLKALDPSPAKNLPAATVRKPATPPAEKE